MTSIARLKDRARKFEQKEDWQAAITAYQRVLETEEGRDELDLELGLYNRIGDLYLRLGQTDQAVSYYEMAADKYAEAGFYNNAIALCNKALRHRPGRPEVYLKLSRLSMEQGFLVDARRWILDYAERKVKAGGVSEALAALADFAEESEDPDIRQLVAQHLASHDRQDEAVEQLRKAHAMWVERGDREAAERVAEKAAEIDPSVFLGGAEEDEVREFGAEDVGSESPAGGLTGLETTSISPPGAVDADEPAADEGAGTLGGLETFDDGGDAAEPDALPMLETGFEDDAEEDVEPLPLLDEDEDDDVIEIAPPPGPTRGVPPEAARSPAADVPEPKAPTPEPAVETPAPAGPAEEEPVVEPAAREPEPEPEPEEPAPAPEEPTPEAPEGRPAVSPVAEGPKPRVEPDDASGEPPLSLDLGEYGGYGVGGEVEPDVKPPPDAMDIDLGSLDLGVDVSGNTAGAGADLDVETVLNRARELVSRGLATEALKELRLLSGSGVGPDVYRQALPIVKEVIRHDPNDTVALQRRVEYAVRTGDKELLVDAYTDLADALARLGSETKAQAMYQRVLDLDPENEGALEALGPAAGSGEAPVDLDAVLDEDDHGGAVEPQGEEGEEGEEGFAAMLSQFRAKSADRVSAEDAGDHYDLGLAFKEMGLIDEAIAEFQRALTGGEERLKVYEELGQCFMLKGQFNVAIKVLNRALQVPYEDDEERIGVFYHLGQCYEELGQRARAREAYEKVLVLDKSFADVPDRVARL
jgi:tetratricopeptide (TPR) repeat protein